MSSDTHHDIAETVCATDVHARLEEHLRRWLGAVPVAGRAQLSITEARDEPGWDGRVRPIQGVIGPEGSVIAVSPTYAELFDGVDLDGFVRDLFRADAWQRITRTLGVDVGYGMPVFRWSERPNVHPEIGEWVDPHDPRLPDWLHPFNGGVLATFTDDDRYRAGVGIKRHNDIGREIAVGTDPAFRRQGLATKLVAQAARRIIAEGGVPIYQHGPGTASAIVADHAGFPDREWSMIEIHPGITRAIRG